MLELVPDNPTQQLADETEDEHTAFLEWLLQGENRKAPPPLLARKNKWATRAAAWDASQKPQEPAKKRLAILGDTLLSLAVNEAGKALTLSRSSDAPVNSTKDVLTTFALLIEHSEIFERLKGDLTNVNWDELDDDEVKIIRQAQKVLKRMGS